MVENKEYKVLKDKVIYEPNGLPANVAIKKAGAISAIESLPVELHINNMVVNVKVAKLLVERIR